MALKYNYKVPPSDKHHFKGVEKFNKRRGTYSSKYDTAVQTTYTNWFCCIYQVANLACSMSVNPEKVKMVRLAAKRLQTLCPQVINAARTLAARPHSKVARENMDVFKEAWEKQLQVLTEAVDDITSIDEFLATTGG